MNAAQLKAARAFLGYRGDERVGVTPTDFEVGLFRLIGHSDEGNRAKLRTVFPEHVAAFEAEFSSWGIGELRERVIAAVEGVEAGLDFSAVAS